MADIGLLRQKAKAIPDPTTRSLMVEIVEELNRLAFGGVDTDNPKATNFALYHQAATTGGSTSEFSLAHGMDRTPHLAILTLDLTQPGATLVPLEVGKAADGRRIYLKSTSTGRPFSLLVE